MNKLNRLSELNKISKLSKPHFILGFCIIAFFIFGLVLLKPDVPDQPPYLSSSAEPAGVKALFTLMQEKGTPIKAWKQPWRSLPNSSGQTLVLIEPRRIGLDEQGEIMDWVSQGNEVMLFASNPAEWELFQLEDSGRPNTVSAISAQQKLIPTNAKLTGEVSTAYRLLQEADMEPLLQDTFGLIAARIPVEAGSVTIFLTPEWLRNDTILRESHFAMIWPYLSEQPAALWFDEYHHGFVDKPGVLAAYPVWLLAVLLQVVIGVLLWLWWKAVRFGPAYTPRAWTVRRGDETLIAAAGWYENRQLAHEALEHQTRYVRGLLRERWGVLLDANDQQVLAVARLHWSKEHTNALAALLQSWRQVQQSPTCSKKRFLETSRKADVIIQKLEGE
ncbi:MAG: DUF4350 domain-containing protein [Gorillibacterium sp.]|nr:DUF4350 domain-containing protein [Gorillibacterium sp.]